MENNRVRLDCPNGHETEADNKIYYKIITGETESTADSGDGSGAGSKTQVVLEDSGVKAYVDYAVGCSTVGSEEKSSQKLFLFGCDISHFNRTSKFVICTGSMISCSLAYSFLQELVIIHMLGRKFSLFLTAVQFFVLTAWSTFFEMIGNKRQKSKNKGFGWERNKIDSEEPSKDVPISMYIFLSILKYVDLTLSNKSMQYINYPARSLIRSCRVFSVMVTGMFIVGKKYVWKDYLFLTFLLAGLVIFLHADHKGSAVFHPIGVLFMTCAIICDGTTTNFGELIMNKYSVGHDQFNRGVYSIACFSAMCTAYVQGELIEGFEFLLTPGSVTELEENATPTWSSREKMFILLLFTCSGTFGTSCASAITKNFGAFATAVTATSRRVLSFFLSFVIFHHECTVEHVVGMVLYFCGLLIKSFGAVGNDKFRKVSQNISAVDRPSVVT